MFVSIDGDMSVFETLMKRSAVHAVHMHKPSETVPDDVSAENAVRCLAFSVKQLSKTIPFVAEMSID